MNAFRNKGVFWGLIALTGMFIMACGFQTLRNETAENLLEVYVMSVRDFVLLGLIIPSISLLVIKEVNDWMTGSRLLAWNSRSIWWMALKKRLLGECLVSAVIIIVPVFLMTNIFMGTISTLGEWIYILFLFFTYLMYFYLLALCIVIIEIKFRQSLLAVSFVLAVSFFPNILSFLLRRLGMSMPMPTISGLLNLSYALDEGSFYWLRCGGVCVILFLLLGLLEKTGEVLVKKQNIYWK